MTGFLLDTHVWVWSLEAPERLPSRLRSTLEHNGDDCWLSPISVWEIAMLARKKRVTLLPDVQSWTAQAFDRRPLREAPLTFDVAQRAEELLAFGDPADTLIAATALANDLTLMTVDKELRRVKGLRTLSR